jgi:DNA-binding MarR family transcriptional regulator
MSSEYKKDLVSILEMLSNIERDLNLVNYNETEKKIYYTIATLISACGACNITDVILESKFSRSTVYKTIKKFERANLIIVEQSNDDKREFNLVLASYN